MAVTSLQVVSVPVSDQDRARQFYADVLGFSTEIDSQFGEGMRWVMLRPPGGGTAITLVTWFDAMPAGSLKTRLARNSFPPSGWTIARGKQKSRSNRRTS